MSAEITSASEADTGQSNVVLRLQLTPNQVHVPRMKADLRHHRLSCHTHRPTRPNKLDMSGLVLVIRYPHSRVEC